MIELSTTKVFIKLGEFAVANGTIREGIEYGMMRGGTRTSVPVVQPCSFRALQLDEQPDHLLILVHGILARSVPLNCSWIGNEVWLFELCILWNLNAWSPLPLEKIFRMNSWQLTVLFVFMQLSCWVQPRWLEICEKSAEAPTWQQVLDSW